jgi:acyl-coenzyme A thioesterase PaaI-like protein
VVQSGRRLSFAEVELRDEASGKAVARGSGVFVIESRDPGAFETAP